MIQIAAAADPAVMRDGSAASRTRPRPGSRRRWSGVLRGVVCAGVAALVACAGDDLGLDETVYVETMGDLYRVQRDSGDQAARDSVLRLHSVTEAQLEEAARRLADDPERAVRLWRLIDRHGRTSATP